MNIRAIIILSVHLLGCLPFPLLADNGSNLQPGTRVRVSTKQFFQKAGAVEVKSGLKPRYLGTIVSVQSDTLEIAPDDLKETLLIPLQYVTKLEIKKGDKSRAGNGALIGLLAGAAIGAAVGALAGGGFSGDCNALSDDDEIQGCSDTFAMLGAIGFGVLGSGVGAVAGAVNKAKLWQEIPLEEFGVNRLLSWPDLPSDVALDTGQKGIPVVGQGWVHPGSTYLPIVLSINQWQYI